MGRFFRLLVLSVLFVLSFSEAAWAEESIIESPVIKIIINGKTAAYSNVPITVNGRTLLPLRALLVDLGVENNDEHIIWNEADSSVTVKKDDTIVYLKADSKEAKVNDEQVTLDAAPVKYKDRVYIPGRFVAQVFGKKVVWYGATNTVLINDETGFNRVKELIEKADIAMNALKRVAFKQDTKAEIIIGAKAAVVEATSEGRLDREKLKGLIGAEVVYKDLNKSIKYGSYLADNTEYTKDPETGEWKKASLAEEVFAGNFRYSSFMSDAAYAGLTVVESPESDVIILKGTVFPENSYKQKLSNFYIDKYTLSEIYYEMYIDKNNFRVTKTYCDLKGKVDLGSIKTDFTLKTTEISSAFDEEFVIEAPEDLKQAQE